MTDGADTSSRPRRTTRRLSRRPVRARASQPPGIAGLDEEETGDTLDEELVEEDLSTGERPTTPGEDAEAMDLEPDTDPHMGALEAARAAGGDDDRTLPRVPAREAVLAAEARYESFDSGAPAPTPAREPPASAKERARASSFDSAAERESVVIVRRAHIISDMPPPPRPTGVAMAPSPAPPAVPSVPQLPTPPVASAPALNALPTPPPVPAAVPPRMPPPPPPVSVPSASSSEEGVRAASVIAPVPPMAPVVPKSDELEVVIDVADIGGVPTPARDDEPTTVLMRHATDAAEPVAPPSRRSGTPPPPPDTKAVKKPPPPPRASRAEDLVTAISPAPAVPPAASASGPAPVAQPRVRQWWERFFSDDYLMSVLPPTPAQISRQVDFLESSLGLPRGGTVLDVGCGLGLHARELAQRGYLVVGLDLSLPMITRAAEEAQQRNLRINFLHTDIREIQFDGAFDGVICLGTTFGFFDDESNRDVLARLYQALRPGGRILLDVVNRDHVISSQPNLVWFQGEDCVCMEESDFNYFNSRLIVKRTMMQEGGQQSEAEYSVRLYSLHELGQLMQQMGFRVMEVSGQEATRGTFFGTHSQRILMLAERRPAQRMSAVMGPERRTSEAPAPPPPKREG